MTLVDRHAPGVRPTDDTQLGFQPSGLVVDVEQVTQTRWQLLATLTYIGFHEHFTIPVGTDTDFASVPRVFVWFIPTYGKYTKAAILHDALCRLAKERRFSRREADGVFRQAMRLQGVDFLRRWVMWAAVRIGGAWSGEGREGWLQDIVPVLLAALVALPIVTAPAVLVAAALVVWYGVEFVSWLGLQLGKQWRRRRGQPAKQVNEPVLSFRL
jgi:hypothetical protein